VLKNRKPAHQQQKRAFAPMTDPRRYVLRSSISIIGHATTQVGVRLDQSEITEE
jgi:hypothetical protein